MRAAAVCLALVGCTVGPNYQRPDVKVPAGFSERAGRGAKDVARWWAAFQDPLLDSLVERAVQQNLDVQIAAARIAEARAARGFTAARGLPQVGAGAAAARGERTLAFGQILNAPVQNVFEAGFDASWELDLFGGVRRDIEAATAQIEAVEEARQDVLVTLVADMARTYVEMRAADRQIAIVDQTVESQRESLALARSRFDSGLGNELDVARAQGLVDATAAQRPALEALRRQSALRIGVLLGRNPEELLAELDAPGALPPAPDVPAVLPSELLTRRPDLRRSERELAAATARIGVAVSDLYPRFNLAGNLGRRSEDFSSSSGFWSAGIGVQWPLFAGGRIHANIRVQEARQQQALLQFRKAVLTALEETENALSAHGRELSRRESLRASVAADRRALELATERYTGGLENFLSVLDAQRAVYAAEDQLVQSERNAAVTLIAVYKALGGGWEG